MLYIHDACPYCMSLSMLHALAACPCCIYMLLFRFFVHASCPSACPHCMSMPHVEGISICKSLLHVHTVSPCCMLKVHVNAACLIRMSLSKLQYFSTLHVCATCSYCMSNCPRWMSAPHAHTNADLWYSATFVRINGAYLSILLTCLL
jgi:hypothetical protein